jgi:hypothetical protein
MSPRARRSESITLPPGNHPGLIRYKDEKNFNLEKEQHVDVALQNDDDPSESDLGFASDDSYDDNDSDDSNPNSPVIEPLGR